MSTKQQRSGAMAKGYWIGNVEIHDPEKYKAYIAANAVPFAKYGAKFLVRGGAHEVREGSYASRLVVIEFPDYATARACYDSPEYQAALKLRLPCSTGNIAIVEGWDG
jgi:uncharacterized protein (DUF1330 family)